MASQLQELIAYVKGGPDAVEELRSGPRDGIMGIVDGINGNEEYISEIAKVIAAEAANQGEDGMKAVANTISNRAKSRNKDFAEIVAEKNQYYGYTNPNRDKIYASVKPMADKIARDLIEGNLKDNTNGAEYFLLPTEKVRKWHGDKTVTIGDHTFYKENK